MAKLNIRIVERKNCVKTKLQELGELLYATHTGTPTESEVLFAKMEEIDALKAIANMPFALGSTDEAGRSAINPMSYVLLDAYKRSALPDVKLHILCGADIPDGTGGRLEHNRIGNNSRCHHTRHLGRGHQGR